MSEPLSLKTGREVLAVAAGAAGVQAARAQVEVTLEEQRSELTRFANNAIHQHVGDRELALSVRTQIGGRTARASTHRLDQEGIEAAAERALALTRVQADDDERLPMATAQEASADPGVGMVRRYDGATAAITPAQRAEAVAAMVGAARRGNLTAAGICATSETRLAILNSSGVEAFHEATGAEYSVTMLGEASSGWAKGSSWRWGDLQPEAAAEVARQKAEASGKPTEIAAQPYTVILEPAAVLDLLGFAMWDFGGQAVLDQRSFLCERLGTKLFGDNVSISDDAGHRLQTGAPFDGEGMPRQRLQLIQRGTVRDLALARQTAADWNRRHSNDPKRATGHGFPLPNEYGEAPMNVVFEGGSGTPAELLAGIERGVLVTRLWYIREVDPYQKILTGMTRDGTFLIENGKLTRGLRNFRFNQSMIELLNHIEAMSQSVRASGEESFDMVVPALRVAGFNFTEVTKF